MSLTHRKARPLVRDAQSLRDDRLFIVACDDTYAPKQYFNFLRLSRVQVHVIPTVDGTSAAPHALERLLSFDHKDYDERWLLLDVDHCATGTHLASFIGAIREAQQMGVSVALSKPCFELWLLLHHDDKSAVQAFSDCKSTEDALRGVLGEYNKTNLKQEHYPPDKIASACTRAEALDQTVTGGEIPSANTTRVYQLLKAIAAKALPSQLPAELRLLIP
jgi:hypothetical protein